MHFRIDRHRGGALPLIAEIPDFGVVRLEGYNGVGKSLTVRLLQVCAASAFDFDPNSEAWRSFCKGLGRLTLTVTKLRAANELRFDIDGQAMLEASVSGASRLEWFEAAERDGEPFSSVDELRSLLSVVRISGEDGLIETLATVADEQSRLIGIRIEPALTQAKLHDAEVLLSSVADLLGNYSSQLMTERREAAHQATAARILAEQSLQSANRRLTALDELAAMAARLEEIGVTGAELDIELGRLEGEVQQKRKELDGANERLRAAEAAAANTQELRRQMESAERSYKNAAGRLRNLTQQLGEALENAGLEATEDLESRRIELQTDLDAARARRVELDASDAMVRLIDQLQPLVDGAIASGLGDQPLLAVDGGSRSPWTVARLGGALANRRAELRHTPNPREAVVLDAQIRRTEGAIRSVDQIRPLLEKRVAAQEKMDDAQKMSAELDEQLDATAAVQLERLRDERRRIDNDLAQLAGQRATVAHRRDALGAPQERNALASSLDERLADLGLARSEIGAQLAAAERSFEIERDAYQQVADLHRSAAAAAERDQAELNSIVTTLSSDSRFEWLKRVTVPSPNEEQSPSEQVVILDRLKATVVAANAHFDTFRQLFSGVSRSLRTGLAFRLRGLEPTASSRLPELQRWLERDVERWFAEPAVARALLGEGASDIQVDLTHKQITWSSGSGETRSKPLETLSSGEQAFAFTQARLALLSQQAGAAANRLIALDEFGAFVSANRMQELATYLQRWRSDHPADQLLLILPANQDYAALAMATSGERAARYRRLAKALEDDEYLVAEFQAT